jgi:hypothetical protein
MRFPLKWAVETTEMLFVEEDNAAATFVTFVNIKHVAKAAIDDKRGKRIIVFIGGKRFVGNNLLCFSPLSISNTRVAHMKGTTSSLL